MCEVDFWVGHGGAKYVVKAMFDDFMIRLGHDQARKWQMALQLFEQLPSWKAFAGASEIPIAVDAEIQKECDSNLFDI